MPEFKKSLLVCLLPLISVLALGCDRRLEAYVPPDQEPPAPERPVRIPGLAEPNPSMAPVTSVAADRPGAGGASIRGQLRLAAGAVNPGRGVLFVIARSGAGGPPLAVKRLPAGPFPMAFELGPGDVMIQGRPFSGPLSLTARVDVDADPLTRDPADLQASLEGSVQPGASGIELVLAPQP